MPYLLLLIGILACSTSVLWIKLSTVDPVILTGLRLAIAVAVLAPWAVRDWRRHRDSMTWGHLRDSAIPGIVLAAHFITWIMGARMTLATNAALVVNLTPLATPFLLLVLMGEKVNRREIIATIVAMLGLLVLFVSDYRADSQHLTGDLVCFGSMFLVATYLTLGRKFRHHPTNLLYVAPLYAFASVAAFAAAPFLAEGSAIDWRAEAPWVFLLALLPTVVGHSLLNQAMRHLRGQVVTVLAMTQFVFAGFFCWLALGEQPRPALLVAATLVLIAGGIVTSGRTKKPGESLKQSTVRKTEEKPDST